MGIKKQEFYEGAALHLLARAGSISSIRYEPPLFYVNGGFVILLKYSTRNRSPWGFTFTPAEQAILRDQPDKGRSAIGLICGADGIAALKCNAYLKIAQPRASAIHLACYRRHGEFYEVSGPDGILEKKVPPSNWMRILEDPKG